MGNADIIVSDSSSGAMQTEYPTQTSASDLVITPLSQSADGVDINSAFSIQTTKSRDEILSSLKIKSGEPFSLSEAIKTDGDSLSYELTFNEPLAEDTVYNFHYYTQSRYGPDLSYAFQTQEGFRVKSSVPAKTAEDYEEHPPTGIPTDTGIQLTFSSPPVMDKISDYFTISPAAPGEWEINGDTLYFVPKAPLKPQTTYTATLKAGFSDVAGHSTRQDYTIYFTTGTDNKQPMLSHYDNVYENFLPNDEIILRYRLGDGFAPINFTVEIYKMTNEKDFSQYYSKYGDSLAGQPTPTERFSTGLFTENSEEENIGYLALDTYPEGMYLVRLLAEDRNASASDALESGEPFAINTFIQINRLSVYSLSIGGDTVFWVNDTSDGKPASGANINVSGLRGTTDSYGRCIMTIPVDTRASEAVSITYRDAAPFAYTNELFAEYERATKLCYYTYLYTDRDEYLPTDTVNIYGSVCPASNDYRLTSNDVLTLSLDGMNSVELAPDQHGAFTHTLQAENMSGYAYVYLKLNDEIIASRTIRFADYSKDRYIIDVKTDRSVYFAGETAYIDLSVASQDDSSSDDSSLHDIPVAGIELVNSLSGKRIGQTDRYGALTDTATVESSTGWRPVPSGVEYSLSGALDNYKTATAEYYTLPGNIMLEHEITDNTVRFMASEIVRSNLEDAVSQSAFLSPSGLAASGTDALDGESISPSVYRGMAVDLDFSLDLYEVTYERVEIGKKYDYKGNVNVPLYSYDHSEEKIDSYSFALKRGSLYVSDLPLKDDPLVSYRALVSYKDTQGRAVSFEFYIREASLRHDGAPDYQIELIRELQPAQQPYAMRLNETSYIRFSDTNSDTPITNGQLMIVAANGRIFNADVGDPQSVPIVFNDNYMYNCQVFGVWFDGEHAYPARLPINIDFDAIEHRMGVSVTFDKESYPPGGEAILNITTTDSRGEPVEASVNISIVDESANGITSLNSVAASNNDVTRNADDYAQEFYASANLSSYSANYFAYTSNTKYDISVREADMDEEKEPNLARDFELARDFAPTKSGYSIFENISTGKAGTAQLAVKLGEGAIKWRLTARAVSGYDSRDMLLGGTEEYITATLPFYADIIMPSEYVEGDGIAIFLKPGGSDFDANDIQPVEYTMRVRKGAEDVFTAVQTDRYFNLGMISAGEYTVNVTAEYRGHTHTLEDTLYVAQTGVRLPLTNYQRLFDQNMRLNSINVIDSPINIKFINNDYYDMISRLLEFAKNSKRADEVVAAAFAQDFFANEWDKGAPRMKAAGSNLPWSSGGLPELLYGSPKFIYTARFTAAFPELVSDEQLNKMLPEWTMTYKDAQTAWPDDVDKQIEWAFGFLMLAAKDKPVLLAMDKYAQNLEPITDYNSAVLSYAFTCAYATLGAYDKAAALTDFAAQPVYSSNEEEAEKQQEFIETLRFYAMTHLEPSTAHEYMSKYTPNKYVSDMPECIHYVRRFLSKNGNTAEVRYTLNGEDVTARLTDYTVADLSLSKAQFSNLNALWKNGDVGVYLKYKGRPSELVITNNKLGLTKEITKVKGNEYAIGFSVAMPDEAPAGMYRIVDRLPSNMRYTSGEQQSVTQNSLYTVVLSESQTVDIWFYYDGTSCPEIKYYALRINDANAAIERAYISSQFNTGDLWGASNTIEDLD
jgi:hypothetical protein